MARELLVDDAGKVRAVSYVDKARAPRRRSAARVVIVGGQRLRIGAAAA